MRKLPFVLAATALLALAIPASAQVYLGADPGGVGVQVGPLGADVGLGYRGYRHHKYGPGVYAYDDDCRVIRERIVTPSGRIVFRTRQICD